jgi:MYXO-CTERM domain-containing protein
VLLDLDKPAKHFLGFDPFPPAVQRFHANIQHESPRRMPQEVIVAAVGALLLGGLLRRTRRREL